MSGDDIIDAEWEEVPEPETPRTSSQSAQRPKLHRVASAPPLAKDEDISPWRSKAFWYDLAKAILIGSRRMTLIVCGIFAVGYLAVEWHAALNKTEAEPEAGEQPAQAGAQPNAEQMLRSWSKVVTGRADASGFEMIDGSGEPGDFCNNSNGTTILKFGNEPLSDGTAIKVFDFFAEFHGETGSGVVGAFWYDPSDQSLLTRNQAAVSADGEHGKSVPDIVHAFDAAGDGTATIDGTAYHVCTM